MARLIAILVCILGTALAAGAQPQLAAGEVRAATIGASLTRAAVDGFATTAGTAWLGYSVAMVDGDHQLCCWNGPGACCGHCRLESGGVTGVTTGAGGAGAPGRPVSLEPRRLLFVLIRVTGGGVDRIRLFSEECVLDASGTTLHWIGSARPADSVALLASFTSQAHSNRLADGALSALAMHADGAGLEHLLGAAKNGETTHVRGQALFWLAQRAGDEAIGAITDAIDRDPETEVKRRAVFALSQLPKDEGVPRLIQVARSNANPAVRKQAMFWLGQSKDPRAVRFFEEILFK